MKERDRARVQSNIEQLDAWRASGMKLKAYCEANGHSFDRWRAWLGVESGWRQALGKPEVQTPGFVQVVAGARADAGKAGSVRITVGREGGVLHATLEVPEGALDSCAALLREVLA